MNLEYTRYAKNSEIKAGDRRAVLKETEVSVDNMDLILQNPKYNRSINESCDNTKLLLETSLNSSVTQGFKSILANTQSEFRNQKTSIDAKENRVAGSSKEQVSSRQQSVAPTKKSSDKSLEQDRRLKKEPERKQIFKQKDQNIPSSSSSTTTPKNNILTKLLKEKPFSFKDNTYSSKYKSSQGNNSSTNTR